MYLETPKEYLEKAENLAALTNNIPSTNEAMLDPTKGLLVFLFVHGDTIDTLSIPRPLDEDRICFAIGNHPANLTVATAKWETFVAGVWLPVMYKNPSYLLPNCFGAFFHLVFPLPPGSTAPSRIKLSDCDAINALIRSFSTPEEPNPAISSWIHAMHYSFSRLNGFGFLDALGAVLFNLQSSTKIALEVTLLSPVDPLHQQATVHINSQLLLAAERCLQNKGTSDLISSNNNIAFYVSPTTTTTLGKHRRFGSVDPDPCLIEQTTSRTKAPPQQANCKFENDVPMESDSSDDEPPPLINRRENSSSEDDSDGPPPLVARTRARGDSDSSSDDENVPELVHQNNVYNVETEDSDEEAAEIDYDDEDYYDESVDQRSNLLRAERELEKAMAALMKDPPPVDDKAIKEVLSVQGVTEAEMGDLLMDMQKEYEEAHPDASPESISKAVFRMSADPPTVKGFVARRRKKQEEAERKKKQKRKKENEKKKKQKVRRKIFSFLKFRWQVRRDRKNFLAKKAVARWGQRHLRGKLARSQWRDTLQQRLAMAERYRKLWNSSIQLVMEYSRSNLQKSKNGIRKDTAISWASLLESVDFVVNDETNDETAKILSEATDKALQVVEEEEEYGQVADDTDYDAQMDAAASDCSKKTAMEEEEDFMGNHTKILYTENVKKWLRGPAGGRYRELFVKRMKQLSRGERSRILAKRLKGSSKTVTVFETYLEQKSGKRILWQIERNNLLVWYVANHDNVSRLLKLIEDSENRKHRRLTSGDELLQQGNNNVAAARRSVIESEAILNPLGNNPLKVYEVSLEDVNEMASQSWVPKLRLTQEEREVVETSGTVLLLGRSGTGKTICTANRMDYDRQQNQHDSSFTQLFVARSQQLCAYVENIIGSTEGTTFETYDQLKKRLERRLPAKEDVRSTFPTELKMRFDIFKREVYCAVEDIDPLLAWTSIRSFIKGSIEATLKTSVPRAISEDEFVDMKVFSSGRCSLTVDQRKIVYPIYERYVRFLEENNFWDDCDRVLALLLRLQHCAAVDPETYHSVQVSKIYVDEVQDYTQSECLLFFYLCNGQGNLFLAGDPAQNVVQGVEFRFQDIRSVEYHIAKDNSTVMQKPKKVHVNFRSHAGILNTAGSILTCLFKAFPKSAENLGEDHGVFVGPRPGVFENVEVKVLADLLANKMNGAVVLVHDATVEKWKVALNYPLIRTIRESKGLEYKSVIILDFFGDLCPQVGEAVQKAWRGLLLRGEVDALATNHPEIESHLKLLYTAITRCIEQLFFVETTETIPGKAFVRWLTTTSTYWHKEKSEETEALATKNKVLDVQAKVMTKDEALQSGIQMASAAEAEGISDVSASKTLLDQALYFFELADEPMYKKKVQVYKESIDIRSSLPPLPSRSDDKNGDDPSLDQYRGLESNVARTVGKLFEEGLLLEGRDLVSCVVPYVTKRTQERLKADIVAPLE